MSLKHWITYHSRCISQMKARQNILSPGNPAKIQWQLNKMEFQKNRSHLCSKFAGWLLMRSSLRKPGGFWGSGVNTSQRANCYSSYYRQSTQNGETILHTSRMTSTQWQVAKTGGIHVTRRAVTSKSLAAGSDNTPSGRSGVSITSNR